MNDTVDFDGNMRVSETKKYEKNTQTRNLAIQIAACAVAIGDIEELRERGSFAPCVWPFSFVWENCNPIDAFEWEFFDKTR